MDIEELLAYANNKSFLKIKKTKKIGADLFDDELDFKHISFIKIKKT